MHPTSQPGILRSELFPKIRHVGEALLFSWHCKKLGRSEAICMDFMMVLAISQVKPVLSISLQSKMLYLGCSFLGERGCRDKMSCTASFPPICNLIRKVRGAGTNSRNPHPAILPPPALTALISETLWPWLINKEPIFSPATEKDEHPARGHPARTNQHCSSPGVLPTFKAPTATS